jgi:ATP-dependent DNA helicase RecG
MNDFLLTPIAYLKGVGPQRAEVLLKELKISTYEDAIMHFPYRYIDAQTISNIADVNPSIDYAYIRGIIMNLREEGSGYRKRLVAELVDRTGVLELVWFQGVSWVKKQIQSNKVYTVYGKISYFNGRPSISHPDIELYEANQKNSIGLIPLYPSTEKLKATGINNKTFGKLVQGILAKLPSNAIPENLPYVLLQQYGLMNKQQSIINIHQPQNIEWANEAIRRQKWEELFVMQMQIGQTKIFNHSQPGYFFNKVGDSFNNMYNYHMPFDLTNAQKRVLKEIRIDVKSGKQMNRLVQGDVGSGKTMVAFLSMLLAIDNGFQACMMAPTEILAQQHYESIKLMAEKLGLNTQLLTGSIKTKAKKQILQFLQDGTINILIGTHALIEDPVVFQNLGLAIIDEQHRFGVGQRAKLWAKNTLPPHILVMTATPIPRTLAMTVYGDLDVSVIDELPPGRKPITTIHRSEQYRPQVMQLVRTEIEKGRQVYIVYPLIDESEKLAYESLMQGYEQVKMWFPSPQYNIAMVHGKMSNEEKEMNMSRFIAGHAHIMVATTVIEVGVNVPNASVMIIESAEKFGLSQLHQLRGRVGRGSEKSFCILLTSNELSKEARQRMGVMVQTNDGFIIAEEDLKMRGPGDIHGTRQSGVMEFKIADIVKDSEILEQTRNAAMHILKSDPQLMKIENLPLRRILHKKSTINKQQWNVIS